MTLFEFTFGLGAVILGLALAEMASRFQQLVFAGRRVKWALEPCLLAVAVFMVLVVVWLSGWQTRGMTETTIGKVALQILGVLAPYMVAAGVFPVVAPEGPVDLHAHYDRARPYLFGVLAAGQFMSWAMQFGDYAAARHVHGAEAWAQAVLASFPFYSMVPYGILIFVRNRWINVIGLVWVLGVFLTGVLGVTLRAT